MSIESEITRIRANIAGAYEAVADRGGTVPEEQTSDGLAQAVRSIPAGLTPCTVHIVNEATFYAHVSYSDGTSEKTQYVKLEGGGETDIHAVGGVFIYPNGLATLISTLKVGTAYVAGAFFVNAIQDGSATLKPLAIPHPYAPLDLMKKGAFP